MSPALYFLFLLLLSFCFAKVEIAVEGRHGWAENLPTWRISGKRWISRLLFSGKPMTGYHVWVEIFILSAFHLPYVFVAPSFAVEAQILAFFFFFCVCEDFLWFVLNPAFGISKFRRDRIWWHAEHWWWIAPRDYYLFLLVGGVLYVASFYL